MSKKLPARVRVHIRDLIDDPDSEVQQALKSINTTVGSSFTLEIAWEDIFRDLKDSFPDALDKLVPSIGRHITIFLQRLESILDQDEKFQETFMEEYPSLVSILTIVIQPGSKTSCKIANRRITLLLPTTGEEGFRYAQASVGADIPQLFKEDQEEKAPSTHAIATEDVEEGWDTVSVHPSRVEPSTSKQDNRAPLKFEDVASTKPSPLPKLKSLQRPEILFGDLLPAFLIIKGHERELFIEGSHSGTINLIGEYFKNFARKDMNDANQSPRLKVQEITSNFGSGTMGDCIKIEVWHRNADFRINIALFLTFIEAVCGYEMVDGKGTGFVYKRTTPF